MNNDLKEQDMTYTGDPMFAEILRDLTTVQMCDSNENQTETSQTAEDKSENSNQNDNSSIDDVKVFDCLTED